jgi:hypothetical protein
MAGREDVIIRSESEGWAGRSARRGCVWEGVDANVTSGDVLTRGILGTADEEDLAAADWR